MSLLQGDFLELARRADDDESSLKIAKARAEELDVELSRERRAFGGESHCQVVCYSS